LPVNDFSPDFCVINFVYLLNSPSHDAINRLLHRIEPEPEELWQEAKAYVELTTGVLVLDDTMMDKWFAKKIELVSRQWLGRHKRVVRGINLTSLLWTDGDRHIPIDYRLYDKPVDGATKNDHFRAMLAIAKQRGFQPQCVAFDSWFSALDNLKQISRQEYRKLERYEDLIEAQRRRALRSGGKLTIAEKQQLNQRLDRQSERIYRDRHDH
jgi:hypothetical protein